MARVTRELKSEILSLNARGFSVSKIADLLNLDEVQVVRVLTRH